MKLFPEKTRILFLLRPSVLSEKASQKNPDIFSNLFLMTPFFDFYLN